jgi:excisionase family DNA binding protein
MTSAGQAIQTPPRPAVDVEPRRFLSPRTAAHVLGVSRSKFYVLIDKGELRAVRIGRARRVTAESVDAFVERRIAEAETGR